MNRSYLDRLSTYTALVTKHPWQDLNLRPSASKAVALIPLSYELQGQNFTSRRGCGNLGAMDNTTPHLNGKSAHQSLIHTMTSERAPKKHGRLLELVGRAIDLELQLKETMTELEAVAQSLGPNELPTMLMAILKSASQPTAASPKDPGNVKVVTPSFEPNSLKGRIMTLMRDGKKRKSSVIIKTLKADSIKSSVYHALKELLNEDHLTKPEYGIYRKA